MKPFRGAELPGNTLIRRGQFGLTQGNLHSSVPFREDLLQCRKDIAP